MAKHDKAYDQPTNTASAGTTAQSGKDSSDTCDAKGHRFASHEVKNVTERPDSKQKELIGQQLGSNGMQSNGYDPEIHSYIAPAPRRGFKNNI
jgi:hypothetical protein